ncbi:hypothetical protein [Mycobacterium sp.]|uniref:hypothetical protein n=1 Tax=Mycobacterium sp. TaxID=1785 RepID=UPI0025CCDA50|nr:hypothetical protein [Mycobacterium sp.]
MLGEPLGFGVEFAAALGQGLDRQDRGIDCVGEHFGLWKFFTCRQEAVVVEAGQLFAQRCGWGL